MRRMLQIAALIALAGCGFAQEYLRRPVIADDTPKAILVLERQTQFVGGGGLIGVTLDGIPVANLGNGESLTKSPAERMWLSTPLAATPLAAGLK